MRHYKDKSARDDYREGYRNGREDSQDYAYETETKGEIQTLSGLNFLLGIWLIISPWVLTYASSIAKWDELGIGIGVLVLAAIREIAPRAQWISFLNGLIGVWAIISPIFINFSEPRAYWNTIIVGIVVALLAFWNSSLTLVGPGRAGHRAGA